jgi:hypothetical protein
MFGSLQGQEKLYRIEWEGKGMEGCGEWDADSAKIQDWVNLSNKENDGIIYNFKSKSVSPQQKLFVSDLQETQPLLRLWDRYEKECYAQADTFWIPVMDFSDTGWMKERRSEEIESRVIKTINPTKARQEEGLIVLPYKLEFDIHFIEWLKKQ